MKYVPTDPLVVYYYIRLSYFMYQLIYHITHMTLRDHWYTATVIDSSRQNEFLDSRNHGNVFGKHTNILHKITTYWTNTYILFFGSAHGRLNRNVFLINTHGVLRRMGAVMEIAGKGLCDFSQFGQTSTYTWGWLIHAYIQYAENIIGTANTCRYY